MGKVDRSNLPPLVKSFLDEMDRLYGPPEVRQGDQGCYSTDPVQRCPHCGRDVNKPRETAEGRDLYGHYYGDEK